MLDDYARLVVRAGVNLQPGQPLVVNAPLDAADFARRVARAAYEAGGRDVTMSWSDELFARLRFELAPAEVFDEYPDWKKKLYDDNAAEGAAVISLLAGDPDAFRGIGTDRLQASQRSTGEALLEYRARLMANRNRWCVVAVPADRWAAKVFPDLPPAEATIRLWREVLAAVRVNGDGGALKRWQAHAYFLRRASDFMNRRRFTALHYTNSLGTDLTVGLPEGHVWAGGAEKAADGVTFVANLPTEEVYTAPHCDRTEGVVAATKPLVYGGSRIEGMRLTFREGRVVDYQASSGGELLQSLLETDEGACRLGEAALVPFDSPISRSGVLFYNGLFDENAACHLALGKAYPTCLEGGEELDSLTLRKKGVNDSLVHEDFMIGSADLTIDGVTAEGREVPVFREGNFVPFD